MYQSMKTRHNPITTPKMMVSLLLRKLILFTKLLIIGNLFVKSFSLVWTAWKKQSNRWWDEGWLCSPPSISLSGWPGSPWSPMQCWSAHLSTCKWQNIKQELTKNRQKAPKSGLTQIYLSELHYEISIFSPKWSLPSVQEFPNWCRLTIATYQDDEFPKWSSHQIEINTKWCPPSDGNSSRWVNFNLGKSQNGWISILLEINLGASQWV